MGAVGRQHSIQQLTEIALRMLNDYAYTIDPAAFDLGCRLFNRTESICILLGGTSGCGKSTLASLLGGRLGINSVVSTDHVRQLMRNFSQSPLLWASSYQAYEACRPGENAVVEGFERQNDLLLDQLESLIRSFAERNESLVIEGVHLSPRICAELAKRRCNVIPFVIYISNGVKHTERFAVRAKYMTLEPRVNKYVQHFENIRKIQRHILQCAEKARIPAVDNTNIDRSLAVIHKALLAFLVDAREESDLYRAYERAVHDSLQPKEALKLIKEKVSSPKPVNQEAIQQRRERVIPQK